MVVVNNVDCIFLMQRYGMKTQRADGYFVDLVGLPWLIERAGRAGMTARIRAANPWYACAYYLALEQGKSNNGPKKLQTLFSRLTELDATVDLQSPIVRRLASHYLVEVTRR